ncbi:hypothetical protein CB1_000709020 [Camelus ferus]|nr:hypothetical protein CB1_000709020 [Camelus ferus]
MGVLRLAVRGEPPARREPVRVWAPSAAVHQGWAVASWSFRLRRVRAGAERRFCGVGCRTGARADIRGALTLAVVGPWWSFGFPTHQPSSGLWGCGIGFGRGFDDPHPHFGVPEKRERRQRVAENLATQHSAPPGTRRGLLRAADERRFSAVRLVRLVRPERHAVVFALLLEPHLLVWSTAGLLPPARDGPTSEGRPLQLSYTLRLCGQALAAL